MLVKLLLHHTMVLLSIANNTAETPVVKAEANGLLIDFNFLETAILTAFWSDTLNKYHAASQSLQKRQPLRCKTHMKIEVKYYQVVP